ncbi:hypothetical protein Avbf_18008 [Armadillidium vulgare]|nr:hypothetical protein Avbf_18008 [Armadillidium vulgare]
MIIEAHNNDNRSVFDISSSLFGFANFQRKRKPPTSVINYQDYSFYHTRPNGIPFFGTFPYATIDELFQIKTGVVNILYICDFKTSKEALSKLEFADRPTWKTMSFFEGEKMQGKAQGGGGYKENVSYKFYLNTFSFDGMFSNGTHWLHNRRFLLRHLRDLGMGKSKMKEYEKGSHRYDFDDEQVEQFMSKIREIQDAFITISIPSFFPILEYILPKPILGYITIYI